MRKTPIHDPHLDNPSHISVKKSKQHNSHDHSDVQLQQSSSPPHPSKMLANRNKSKTEIGKSQSEIDVPSWMPPNPLNPELFTPENATLFKQQYDTAKPYRHVQFPALCTKQAMADIQREVINYLPTTSRETDLFKVNQSIDLNNVDLNGDFAKERIPTLMSLRTYLYSQQFRQFLQQVTSCSAIIDTVDCAANVYSGEHGNHLLAHDDVISSRVLSYIIYLPLIDINETISPTELVAMQADLKDMIEQSIAGDDNSHIGVTSTKRSNFDASNSSKWVSSMGGHLELFDKVNADILPFGVYPSAQDHIRDEHRHHDISTLSSESRDEFAAFIGKKNDNKSFLHHLPPKAINIPLSIPSKLLSPNFNTMVVFEVKPQSSYHAVQEVYSINSKRISIQGWFHQDRRQPDYGATLRMLQIPTLPPSNAVAENEAEKKDQKLPQQSQSDDLDDVGIPNERNVYDLVIRNKLSELNNDELSLVTRDLFPERSFQLFKYLNDSFFEDSITALNSEPNDGPNAGGNISTEEIDYLSKIILLYVHQVMLKQRLIQQDIAKSVPNGDATTSSKPTTSASQSKSEPTLTTAGNQTGQDSTTEDVDLYSPELVKNDLQFLRKFIAKEYTSVSILQQLQSQWQEQSVIQLGNFLKPELIQLVVKSLIRTDVVDHIALLPDFATFFATAEEEDCEEDQDGADEDDDMDFDFGLDDEDDDMDFDFGADEDDSDDEGDISPTMKKTEAKLSDTAAKEHERMALLDELFESTPVLTNYQRKVAPPAYDVGITPLRVCDHVNGQSLGGWKLSGPAYLQRYAYFESILHRETHRLLSVSGKGEGRDNTQQTPQHTKDSFTSMLAYFNSLDIHMKSGLILEALTKFLFGSVAFTRIVEWITDIRLLCFRSTIRRFRCGLDYSVGNYNDMIECSDVSMLQAAVAHANDDYLESSQKRPQLLPTLANMIDIDSLTPSSLSMLDIVLSFADNGTFDHLASQNIWETDQHLIDIESGKFDDGEDAGDDKVVSKTDSIAGLLQSNVALEKQLYHNAVEDIMLPDINPFLELVDETIYQLRALESSGIDLEKLDEEQVRDEKNSAFSTLPPCHVRFKPKQHRWDCDDAGGFCAYIPVDVTTEGDDAQQYVEQNAEDEEQLISLSLSTNTLTICKHKPNVLNFVRYVNFHAPGSRWDISLNCIYQNDQ